MAIAERHGIRRCGVIDQRPQWNCRAAELGQPFTATQADCTDKKEEPVVFGSSF
jgi:hypothetical protein